MDLTEGFRIGDWDVLPREGRIAVTGGESRRVRRKAMDVLVVLAARAGQVVERDDLLAEVWGRTAVTDEPLTATIGELRRLLGERQGQERRYIETIPKRGYRLLAEVQPLSMDGVGHAAPATPDETGAGRLAPVVRIDWKAAVALVVLAAVAVLAFQRLTAPDTVPVPERSIAVLPFENLSVEGDHDYLADGLAEELISLLTRVPELQVAARGSAFAFRGQALAAEEIAQRLKVAHLLTGSVQRMGKRVRVTAQLVDGRQGYQLWSDTYDRTLDDIFAIQDEIAGEVSAQLRLHLLGNAVRVRETDTRAYTLYLQARHIGRQHSGESLKRAAELYREALEIDPTYLPAWNELAGVNVNLAGLSLVPPDEAYGRAREAAYKALAIDPDYAPAHDRLGWLALYEDDDLRAAAEHYQRALTLEPDNEVVRSHAAVLAVGLGRLRQAIALLEASTLRDPVSATAHANLANAYRLARRYAEAERSIRTALTLSPQYAAGHYRLAQILLAEGDLEGARAAVEQEALEAGRLLGQALVANAEGHFADSDAALAQVRDLYGDAAAGNMAQIYGHRGDADATFEWLEVEYRANGAGAFLEYQWDPLFDPVRDDPRWPALLERIGFGESELAAIEFPALDALQGAPGASAAPK